MTLHDEQLLKASKSDYAQAMSELFGPNWKIISRRLKVYNIPEDEKTRKELINESLKLQK